MTFEQALERLKLGRKIKRIDWGKKYICISEITLKQYNFIIRF